MTFLLSVNIIDTVLKEGSLMELNLSSIEEDEGNNSYNELTQLRLDMNLTCHLDKT